MSGTLAAVMVLAMAGEPRFGVLEDQQHVLTKEARPAVVVSAAPAPEMPPIEFVPMAELEPEEPAPVVSEAKATPAKKPHHKPRVKKLTTKPKPTNECTKG